MSCAACEPTQPSGLERSVGYVAWHNRAEVLLAEGWTQRRCDSCRLWSVWVKPQDDPATVAALALIDRRGTEWAEATDRIEWLEAFRDGWRARGGEPDRLDDL